MERLEAEVAKLVYSKFLDKYKYIGNFHGKKAILFKRKPTLAYDFDFEFEFWSIDGKSWHNTIDSGDTLLFDVGFDCSSLEGELICLGKEEE